MAFLTFGMAALMSRRVPNRGGDLADAVEDLDVVPYVPVAITAFMCVPTYFSTPGLGPIFVSSTLLMSAVMVRQYMVVRQNQGLLSMVADQALRDTLSGLANRDLFNDRLMHAVHVHEQDKQSVALLSMARRLQAGQRQPRDPAGDALLIQAAERLQGCVRRSDTVARVGGDEFAVLMKGLPELSRLVAHRVVAAFEEPFVIDASSC